jgi:hypothetical protein
MHLCKTLVTYAMDHCILELLRQTFDLAVGLPPFLNHERCIQRTPQVLLRFSRYMAATSKAQFKLRSTTNIGIGYGQRRIAQMHYSPKTRSLATERFLFGWGLSMSASRSMRC